MSRYLAIPLPVRIGVLLALFFGLLLWAAPARADAIARNGSDWVRLTLNACKDPQVVAVLTAQGKHPDAYRAGSAHLSGHDFEACWQPAPGGAALVYSDGDPGFVPAQDFKPTPEA